MKFLITGDLHGKKPKIRFKDFDAIIMPGDICGDTIIRPLVIKWLKAMKKSGKIDFMEFMHSKLGKKGFKKAEKKNLQIGNKIMRYLDSFDVPVYFVPGNWDQSRGGVSADMSKSRYHYIKGVLQQCNVNKSNPKLFKGTKNIIDCPMKLYKEAEFNIIGYGISSSPELPPDARKQMSRKDHAKAKRAHDRVAGKLSTLYKKRNKNKPTIFLTHNVPYGTKIDIIKNKNSPLHNKHWGSTVAASFIKKHKPLVCIGGHMHEHFGKTKLGKTVCIDAGFGPKVNTMVEITGKKIKKIKFYK